MTIPKETNPASIIPADSLEGVVIRFHEFASQTRSIILSSIDYKRGQIKWWEDKRDSELTHIISTYDTTIANLTQELDILEDHAKTLGIISAGAPPVPTAAKVSYGLSTPHGASPHVSHNVKDTANG